jgi:hypothetical protein
MRNYSADLSPNCRQTRQYITGADEMIYEPFIHTSNKNFECDLDGSLLYIYSYSLQNIRDCLA